ncbi:MAG: hypothetical protein AAF198_02825 [Pseudomonadota bacterium]
MTRLTKKGMANGLDARRIHSSGLKDTQVSKRRILEREYKETGNPAIRKALDKQDRLIAQYQRSKQFAHPSAQKKKRRHKGARKDYKSPSSFNECGLETGRSYASRSGQRMERKKVGFSIFMRNATTINAAILPLTALLDIETQEIRPQLRRVFNTLSEGSQVEGMFQISIHHAEYLSEMFPREEWPAGMDPINEPNAIFILLHWHGDVSDPYLSRQSVRDIIAKAFPGKRRVCVRNMQEELTDKYGQKTNGPQGWHEYCCSEKTEINLKDPKLIEQAIVALAIADATWSRRNRTFSMGKSLKKSGVAIDPARVKELYISEQLDWLRKNKSKLDYAVWFLHFWRCINSSTAQKTIGWKRSRVSYKDSVCDLLYLIRNWCDDLSFDFCSRLGFLQTNTESMEPER